jgi:hypothetical protein
MFDDMKLLDRSELAEIFEPFEDISHVDVEIGGSRKVEFSTKDAQDIHEVPHAAMFGQEYPMTSAALIETAKAGGMNPNYARKCPSNLLFHNMAHWWGPNGSGKARFLIKGNTIISCMEGYPAYFTNMQLLEAVEKAVGGSDNILGYAQPEIQKDHSIFSVVINQSFEALSGDPLFGGIEIQNSLNAERTIEVAPFVYRQVCANGMIVSENLARFKRSNNENCNLWTQQATKSAVSQIDSTFCNIKRLTEVGLDSDPTNTTRSLFQRFGLTTKVQTEIVGEASVMNSGEGPKTMYDLWNAITRVATHSPKLTMNSSRELRMVAGAMVHEVSLCGKCGSLYNHDH